jgi:hypothetical protein
VLALLWQIVLVSMVFRIERSRYRGGSGALA